MAATLGEWGRTDGDELLVLSARRLGVEQRLRRILILRIGNLGGEGPVPSGASPDKETCDERRVSDPFRGGDQ